jgi:hypothetical protein
MAQVHPADVQDRDGAPALLKAVRRLFPFLEKVIGDGATTSVEPWPCS